MNLSAWNKFRKQQATERGQLQRLVLGMKGLLAKCRTTAPTQINRPGFRLHLSPPISENFFLPFSLLAQLPIKR